MGTLTKSLKDEVERLMAERAELVALLRDANRFWREGTSANPAAVIGDTDDSLSQRARALLTKLGAE